MINIRKQKSLTGFTPLEMQRRTTDNLRKRKLRFLSLTGFTLLELIIVIIVIGILASIALPQYKKVVERGRVAEGLVLLSALRSAQLRYFDMTGNYSNDVGKLDVEYSTPKYFDGITVRDDRTEEVARVNRNTVDYSGETYFLYISPEGNVTCSNSITFPRIPGDACSKAGF